MAKKPAPKKTVKKAVKKAAPKAKKPAAKKVAPKKASKPAPKKPIVKKQSKTAPKAKKVVKKVVVKKPAPKKTVVKKAIAKKSVAKPTHIKTASPKPGTPKAEVKKHATNPVAQPRVNHKSADNRTRYSDRELLEFKNLIDEKMEAARQELKYLQDQINRKDDNGTDDTENKFGSIEDGSVAMEREYMSQMATRQSSYIDHLEKALMRIESKTYGICRVTGKLIDKERLRAVPHATLSIEAKMMQGK